MKLTTAKCPNCGAEIDVDENSDSTKCEYCNSKILVEEAIEKYKLELSGEVEIKGMPKVENYLKLAERYYNDKEYEEAYKQYSKVCELEPENYNAILKRGLSKALCTNYENFDLDVAINGMKNAYKLMKENNVESKIVNNVVVDCNNAIFRLRNNILDYYNINNKEKRNRSTPQVYNNEIKFNFDEVTEFRNRLTLFLNEFEQLYNLVEDNEKIKHGIGNNVIDTINELLKIRDYSTGRYDSSGYVITQKYELKKEYKNELLNKKLEYEKIINPEKVKKDLEKEKNEKQSTIFIATLGIIYLIGMILYAVSEIAGTIYLFIVLFGFLFYIIFAKKENNELESMKENKKASKTTIIAVSTVLIVFFIFLALLAAACVILSSKIQ